jgi:HEAT repeats
MTAPAPELQQEVKAVDKKRCSPAFRLVLCLLIPILFISLGLGAWVAYQRWEDEKAFGTTAALMLTLQTDRRAERRKRAAHDLGYGCRDTAEARDAASALAKALSADADPSVREACARMLGWLGKHTVHEAGTVISALKTEKDEGVKLQLIIALGEMWPASLKAVPALEELLKHKNLTLRMNAADALEKIKAAQEKAD